MSGHNSKNFAIKERRRQVASLLARSLTQTEIAQQLCVDQSTVSDDVKALRLMSQRFIYDLAKSDLGFYYKQCLDGIEQAKREAWRMYHHYDDRTSLDFVKPKLMALKIAIQAEEARFRLLTEGPNILTVKAMEERLNTIEQNVQKVNRRALR